MAKQLNIDMNFRANTSQAQQAINQLQTAIQKLGYGSAPKGVLAADFEKASAAARELSYHLSNAFNTNTGNLDLSKLNTSLKNSGTNLATLTANFKNAGTAGQEAFVALSKSIANADQPAITLNTTLSGLLTTLKNTAKWQISSSILHGFMGALNQAKGYAWDLNESLNNIRIVTGQNIDQMAKFADQANKAAKSLSTTTTDYTNASLIYYQQGLDDASVKARTDTTIKLANAAGISAEQASERLTAIWNNFDDGSQSLEHYADVLVKLGAETASSSEEISQGMQKFAAVGQTVGLSYEYAAAALATVTATTRESADTVGTAFRTLFSRIEGLQLGKQQDDGTTLNKYSKALESVGVSIKTETGEMKAMNDVLDELGAKWKTLSNDTQIALAETVGGVRQYTQLMALMNNYDFFKENVGRAQNADGTLQEQADIYAESWEAARDRVKASAEAIYQDLIDDEFFIKLNNGFASLLSGLDKFIDGFGGLKSVILSVGAIILGMISDKIGPAIQKTVQDIQIITGGSGKVYNKMQVDFNQLTNQEINSGNYNASQEAELRGNQALLLAKTKLGAVSEQLSAQEKMRAELAIQGLQLQVDNVKKLAEEKIAAEKKVEEAKAKSEKAKDNWEKEKTAAETSLEQRTSERDKYREKELTYKNTNIENSDIWYRAFSAKSQQSGQQLYDETIDKQHVTELVQLAEDASLSIRQRFTEALTLNQNEIKLIDETTFQNLQSKLNTLTPKDGNILNLEKSKGDLTILMDGLGDLSKYAPEVRLAFEKALSAETTQHFEKALETLQQKLKDCTISSKDFKKVLKAQGIDTSVINNYIAAMDKVTAAQEKLNALQEGSPEYDKAMEEYTQATEEAKQATDALGEAQKKINENAKNLDFTHTVTGIQAITSAASAFGQTAMLVNSLKSMFTTLGDETATAGEKITAIFTGVSMAIPGAIGAFKGFATAISFVSQTMGILNTQQALSTALSYRSTLAKLKQIGITRASIAVMTEEQIAEKAKIAAQTLGISTENALILLQKIREAGSVKQGIALALQTFKEKALNGEKAKGVVVTLALKLAEDAAAISAWHLVAAIGILTVGAAAVAGAIVGIIALIKEIRGASLIGQIDKTTASIKALEEQLDETKNKANDLNSAFDSYTSAIETLDKCTKGTKEWEDALAEVAKQTQDLIDKYPELISEANAYKWDEDLGTYILDQAALEKYTNEVNNQVNTLTAAKAYQQADLAGLNSQKASNVLSSAMFNATHEQDMNGEYFSTVDEKANQQVQALIKNNLSDLANVGSKEELNARLTDLYKKEFGSDQLTPAVEGVINAFQDLYGVIGDAGTAINEYANAQKNATIQATNAKLTELGYADETTRVLAQNKTSGKYDAEIKRLKDYYNINIGAWGNSNSNTFVKDLWDEYIKASGIDYLADSKVKAQGTENNRTFKYKDSSGDWQTVSKETVYATIAAAKSLETLGTDAAEAAEMLATMEDSAGEAADGIKNWITSGTFDSMTSGQFGNLHTTWEDKNDEDKKLQAKKELEKAFGVDNIEEIATAMGKTSDELLNEYIKDAENYYAGLDELQKKVHGINLDIDTTDMSVDIMRTFTNLYDEIGQVAGNEAKQIFSEIAQGLNKSGLTDEFVDVVNNFDWTTGTISQFKDALEDAGIPLEQLPDNIDLWIQKMQEANKELLGLDAAYDKYASVNKIIKDLKTGDTIKSEDYDTLVSAGIEGLDDYFIRMADGTYKMIGDAEKFYDIANGNGIDNFKQIVENNQGKLETLNKVKESKFDLSTLQSTAGIRGFEGATQLLDTNQVQTQLDLLSALGYDKQDQLETWSSQLDNNSLQYSDIEQISKAVTELTGNFTDLDSVINVTSEGLAEDSYAAQTAIAMASQSLSELFASAPDDNVFGAGLINLASQYDNCTEELNQYQQALNQYNQLLEDDVKGPQADNAKALLETSQNTLIASVYAGELGKNYGIAAEDIEIYAEQLKASGKYTEANDRALLELAKDQLRYDKALKSATSNMSKWKKAVADANKGQLISADTISEMKEAYADLLDLNIDDLSSSFVTDNLDDFEKALNGDAEAYQRLQDAAKQEIEVKLNLDKNEKFQDALSNVQNLLSEQNFPDLKVGAELDDKGFLDALTEMVNAAGMTADQATSYLSSMGVDATVVEDTEPTTEETVAYAAHPIAAPVSMRGSFGAEGGLSKALLAWVPGWTYTTTPVTERKTATAIGLKVTSANKSSGGATKFASRGSSGGGGGGGGGSKPATKTNTRYSTVNAKLSDSSRAQSQLKATMDTLWGTDKLEAFNALLAEQTNEIDLLNKKYAETKQYLNTDLKDLRDLGLNLDIDKHSGIILNYDDVEDQLYDLYGGDNETYSDAKEKLDQYVETVEQVKDVYAELADKKREYQASLLEKVTTEYELKVKIDDTALEILDYQLRKIEDDAFASAERIGLMTKQLDGLAKKATDTQESLFKFLAQKDEKGNNTFLTEEEIEAFKNGDISSITELMNDLSGKSLPDNIDQLTTFITDLISLNEQIDETRKAMFDELITAFDAWNEELDQSYSKFDHYNKMLTHYKDIIDLVGKDTLGVSDEVIAKLDDAMLHNAQNQLASATEILESQKAVRDETAKLLENELLSDDERKELEDTLQHYDEQIQESTEQWADAYKNALEVAAQAHEDAVNRAQAAYEKSISGMYGSLAELRNAMDGYNKLNGLYLQDYEKIYELSKLNRDIEKSLGDIDNGSAKKELIKLQEELNKKQQAGVKISEHDVEALRKRYELKVAEAELNNQKNAKSTVSMTRDSEGNWGYLYTANEEDVANAEQNYEDKLFEYQQMNYDYIQQLQDMAIECQETVSQRLAEIELNSALTLQEKEAAKEAVLEQYYGTMDFLNDQLEGVFQEQAVLYDEDWQNYSIATGYRISANEDYITSWDQTTLAMATGFGTIEGYWDALSKAIGTTDSEEGYLASINAAQNKYQTDTAATFDAAGQDITDYGETVEGAVIGITQESDKASSAITTLSSNMKNNLETISTFIGTWKTEYANVVEQICSFNDKLIASCEGLLAELENYHNSPYINPDAVDDEPPPSSDGGSGEDNSGEYSGGGSGGGYWVPAETKKTYIVTDSEGNKLFETTNQTEAGQMVRQLNMVEHIPAHFTTKTEVVRYDYVSGKTGMYTGQWNGADLEENGRWALLHQKELVLNADDTEKILNAVDIVRTIDMLANSQSLGLNNLMSAMPTANNQNTLEQNVTIHAEFPNAVNHSEIEEAFNNLVGKASQYANRFY